MEGREGFIQDSKLAVKGVLNGIIGSIFYEFISLFAMSFIVTSIVSANNSGVTGEQLEILVDQAYQSFPASIIISCLTSLVTLIVFVVILKWKNFITICRKCFDIKIVKHSIVCLLCIMFFSIFYNSIVEGVFKLGTGGNANQENVVKLIKSNVLLGFVSVVVLAPIVEELTYRYCMFGGLCRYKKWIAYAVTGVVFMAMHGVSSYISTGGFNKEFLLELVYLPPYLFSGLALAYVYDKTSNIGSSTLAHALNNLVSFLAIICL